MTAGLKCAIKPATMQTKQTSSPKRTMWGDDYPEKLKSTPPPTIGLKQQLGGLFNPDKLFGSLTNGQNSKERWPSPYEKKSVAKSPETLIFSHQQRKENQEVAKETQVILSRLKEQITILEKSEKALSHDIAKVKVEQMPKKTGIYYLRYLEWLLTVVRQLQIKVSEGRAWINEFSNRQKKKLGYWKKYKKHGTTFGLSHERTVATQTG